MIFKTEKFDSEFSLEENYFLIKGKLGALFFYERVTYPLMN